jgi:multiple antibiotic resistance protein
MMRQILLAFVPVFVAVDPLAILPIFMSLTKGLTQDQKKKIIIQSVITAISVAIFFIFLGKATFKLLGITIGDFMVAGGIVLFCIAVIDLLVPGKKRREPADELGAVPIGTPLIVGPAVLTTCLIIIDQYGIVATITSVVVNVVLAGVLFFISEKVVKVVGKAGVNALSKIMALLLVAIAVMMIRKGIFNIING